MPTRTTVYTAETALVHIVNIINMMNTALVDEQRGGPIGAKRIMTAMLTKETGELTDGTPFEIKPDEHKPSHAIAQMLWTDTNSSLLRQLASLANKTFEGTDDKEQHDSEVLLLQICAYACLKRHHEFSDDEAKVFEGAFEREFPIASTAEITTGAVLYLPTLLLWGASKTIDTAASFIGAVPYLGAAMMPVKALCLITTPAASWASSKTGDITKASYYSVRGYLTWRNMLDLANQHIGTLHLRQTNAQGHYLLTDGPVVKDDGAATGAEHKPDSPVGTSVIRF